jgi:hypothetical protein
MDCDKEKLSGANIVKVFFIILLLLIPLVIGKKNT